MALEIPVKPTSRDEVHRLEVALLLASLFRPEVMEMIRDPNERVTWIDSLAVAAAAKARAAAGMPISKIAEELGRSEATIRNHLAGKTKAGKIVNETYEMFVREGVKIPLPSELEKLGAAVSAEKFEEVKKQLEAVKKERDELKGKVAELEKRVKELENKIATVKNVLSDLLSKL